MMSTVVQIALAIQEEEAAWRLVRLPGAWFAVREPLVRVDSKPPTAAGTIERYYIGGFDFNEDKAREDFKNRVAIACAKAVLLIVGAEPKPKGPRHETEAVSVEARQRRDDSVD